MASGIPIKYVSPELETLKPFNCLLPVLSLSFFLTYLANTLVHSVLL